MENSGPVVGRVGGGAGGGVEDELAFGVLAADQDAATDEAGVAGGWDLEIEVEVLNGIGEGLQALVVGDDAEGGGALRGDFELNGGPADAGRFDGTAGHGVRALLLEFHGGIVFENGVGGFREFGSLVFDEFLDGGVGAAFGFGGEQELVEGLGEVILRFEDQGEVVAGFSALAVTPGGADPGFGFGDFVVAVEDPAVGIPCVDEEGGARECLGAGFAFVGGFVEEIEGAAGGGFGEGKIE